MLTGFFDKTSDPGWLYNNACKDRLVNMCRDMAWEVTADLSQLKDCVTHVVVPHGCRTAKSLSAGCLGKFVLPPSWVEDSHSSGVKAEETRYCSNSNTGRPFAGKVFCVRTSFMDSCSLKKSALTLITKYGNGRLWHTMRKRDRQLCGGRADFTLVGDAEAAHLDPNGSNFLVPRKHGKSSSRSSEIDSSFGEAPVSYGTVLTWDSFLQLVPGNTVQTGGSSCCPMVTTSPAKEMAAHQPPKTDSAELSCLAPNTPPTPPSARRRLGQSPAASGDFAAGVQAADQEKFRSGLAKKKMGKMGKSSRRQPVDNLGAAKSPPFKKRKRTCDA